jgi:hypothetical protein
LIVSVVVAGADGDADLLELLAAGDGDLRLRDAARLMWLAGLPRMRPASAA